MSLWFVDKSKQKESLIQHIKDSTLLTENGELERHISESVTSLPIGNKEVVTNTLLKLIESDKLDRACKIVNVIDPRIPRLWWYLPFLILAWPFRIIYRLLLLGFPK